MALVVFLSGVNIGGHKTFRPTILATQLKHFDAINIGAAGTFVIRQTGKTIPYRNMPAAEYAAALAGFGLPEPVARAIAGWDVDASNGALFDDGRQLSALIGRPKTPLSDSVAESLKKTAKAG